MGDTQPLEITVNTGDTVPLGLYHEQAAKKRAARAAARDWEQKASELRVEVAALKVQVEQLKHTLDVLSAAVEEIPS